MNRGVGYENLPPCKRVVSGRLTTEYPHGVSLKTGKASIGAGFNKGG